jgi:hypothetical protein
MFERRGLPLVAMKLIFLSLMAPCHQLCSVRAEEEVTIVAHGGATLHSPNPRNTLSSDWRVCELDLDSFAPTIGSSSFTLVLFYDRDDTSVKTQRKHDILSRLAHEYYQMKQPPAFFMKNIRVSFAKLDIRKHNFLRWVYSPFKTRFGVGREYDDFYEDYDKLDNTWSPITHDMVNSTTFMSLDSHQLPKFPTRWMLFNEDFNILNYVHSGSTIDGVAPVVDDDYSSVRLWLGRAIRDDLHFVMQGVGQPRWAFGESNDDPKFLIKSRIYSEREQKREYAESDAMGTIDWEAAGKMAAKAKENEVTSERFNPDLHLVDKDDDGETFYKYQQIADFNYAKDAVFMKKIAKLAEVYLAWAGCYENLWDDERKAREDERTNYGFYLKQMNLQVKDMLFSVFEDDLDDRSNPLIRPEDIPTLKHYFEDMLFGYGRSPATLNNYLHENVYNANGNTTGIELFERIREYMHVRETVGVKGEERRYAMYFRTLQIKWAAILAEFHTNLSRHYVSYRQANPDKDHQNRYVFEKLDVIDMGDPDNFEFLSNYDEFERRYTAKRQPYILSNVELTKPYNYTLAFLVKKCGFVDVTKSVRESYRIGDESVKNWGGLTEFELPEELMTDRRYSYDNDEEETEHVDHTLSLEQFVALSERFDNLYLHDFPLKKRCSTLFMSETPYDPPEQQYFRIPSVIGRYDLYQKLPKSRYANSWPSLFVGRKGTNSKMHIDSGKSGFWMYLVSGRKRWVLYDAAERPFLYERLDRNSFLADVLALNSSAHPSETEKIHEYFDATYPLLDRATRESGGYEIIQEADQLVFIPPGTPHAVENLEDIVGISFNLVPRAGIAIHLHNMIHGDRNFGSLEITLRYLMTREGLSLAGSSANPLYTTFGDNMAQ